MERSEQNALGQAVSTELALDRPGTGPAAIDARDLTKRFGKTEALAGLTMRVPQGSVYALLGRNGAGKSTFIQMLLGLLEPTKGDLRVLGLNPMRDGERLRRRIGYIPERLPMYDWMDVGQILRFVAAQYPTWSADEERHYLERFRIPMDRKVGELSRGQRALLSLVLALGHRPELILLDECTSGMDAIARNEFDRSVIDALHESGRTILFASHQIRELERLCDWVGIIDHGRLLLEMPVDEIKAAVRTIRVRGPEEALERLSGEQILARRRLGREWLFTVASLPGLPALTLPDGASIVEEIDLSLEEIFIALLNEEGR
jgi:ABC-2 type transport system ATP-binding protein